MGMFKTVAIYHLLKYNNPRYTYPILEDPTTKCDIYLFARKESFLFEEVWDMFLHIGRPTEYYGAMSLIYWEFYNELYERLQVIAANEEYRRKYLRAIKKFYRKYLQRWVEYVRYSDDAMFPQNEVFRKMEHLIFKTYYRGRTPFLRKPIFSCRPSRLW